MIEVAKADLASALHLALEVAGPQQRHTGGLVCLTVESTHIEVIAKADLFLHQRVLATVSFDEQPRSALLPVALLAQLVGAAASATLRLDLQAHELVIHSGQSQVTVGVATDPPPLSAFDQILPVYGGSCVALEASELVQALSATLYAASPTNFQAVMRHLLFEGSHDGLRVVATDGYRVALAELAYPPTEPFKLGVHAAHLRILVKLLSKQRLVSLQFGDVLAARSDSMSLSVPLMDRDSSFPDYRRVLPNTHTTIKCDTAAFKAVIHRVAILTDDSCNYRVDLTCTGGFLTAQAHGIYGSAQDTIQADLSGMAPAVALSVNAKFLLEALATMSGTLRLQLANPTQPFMLTSERQGVSAVLVPLRK